MTTLQAALADRYTLDRELGRGGMATVYLAQDLKHHRPVALKVLRPELAAALGPERFLQEIRTTARLQHPHILTVLDSGDAAGQLWYTMPYVRGESLRERIRREVQLPVDSAVELARQVALALDYAHREGIVHRDIKPENILLSETQALVADFGVAKALESGGEQLTGTGIAVGTPQYMSPEQATSGQADTRTDIYALGCVLYEMLTGEPPFTGRTPQAVIAKRLLNPIPRVRTLRETVPDALEQVLTKALARAPADRFQSAGEFARALNSVPPGDRRPSRRLTLKLALSIAGVGVLLAGGYLAARSFESRGPATLLETGAFRPRERVLLADFGALQVDSGLARVLTELLRIDLAQSPAVTLVPSSQVTEVLGRMGKSNGANLDPALAREAAVREGIKGVLTGEIARAGSQYVLSAQLVSAGDGQVLAAQRETALDSTVLIAAADRLSKSLRARIGESLKSMARAAPLERVSTRSLEAVRLYTRALQAGDHDNDGRRAIALLQQAIALDSGFAMAYRTMGIYQRNAGMLKAALGSFSAALKRRDRLTDRERYLTLGDYHSLLFEPEQSIAAYRSLLESHPDDREALNNLGVLYLMLRRPGEAEPMFQRAIEVDSSFWQPRIMLVISQFLAGKRSEAFSSYRRAIRQRPDDPSILIFGVAITARSGDYAEATRLTRELKARHRSNPDVRAMSDASLGELAATQGRITEADGHWRDAMMASVDASSPGQYLFHAINRARVQVLVGRRPDAGLRIVSQALARYPLKQIEPLDRPYLGLAQLYATTGNPGQARRLVLEYQRTIEPRLQRQATGELELAQGQIALAEHRFSDAVSWHESAARHGMPMAFGLPELGRAYDVAGRSDSAIAVYRRYLATPDVVAAVPDALYRAAIFQRLGELYESSGERDQAAAFYSRFVELWKDCDPELRPRVTEARRALARLTSEPGS